MIRMATVAALAAVLASPAFAQSSSYGSTERNSGINSNSRLNSAITAPCQPIDSRPECQQAALPESSGPFTDMPSPGAQEHKPAPNPAQAGGAPGNQTGDTVSRLR